jgi:hypothetical protein
MDVKQKCIMAKLTLEIANTGEQVPVNDVNLDKIPEQVMSRMLCKYKKMATLTPLGFVDGNTIKVVVKHIG